MVANISRLASVTLSVATFGACAAKVDQNERGIRGGSRMSSITMPIPEALKAHVAEDKINAMNLSIVPSNCDLGVTGTTVNRKAIKVDVVNFVLANEKIRQACEYTLVLSLGRANSSRTELEKVYLTNDTDGKRTKIPLEQTKSPKIRVTATLYVTEAGKNDLQINGELIPVPSQTLSDAEISIDIDQSGNRPPQEVGDYDPRREIQLVDVPTYDFSGRDYGSAYYRDIMTHVPAGSRDFQSGPSTHAHESLHGLNSVMRSRTRDLDNFVYFGNGKGAYVIEPRENSKDIRNHIGGTYRQLASFRIDIYLTRQALSWSNTLFVFDEWSAYNATTRSAVEIFRAGQWNNEFNSDPVDGLADFIYFSSAALLTIKKIDPDYLIKNKQFKAVFALQMEESVRWMNEAKKENIWRGSAAWKKFSNLQTAPDAEPIREAVRSLVGPVWTKRVLGF
jgi:hypothetical protein